MSKPQTFSTRLLSAQHSPELKGWSLTLARLSRSFVLPLPYNFLVTPLSFDLSSRLRNTTISPLTSTWFLNMESRFRIRFWSPRRVKRNPAELDLHSVPYQTAPADPKQPVFIHESLGRNLSEKRKKEYHSPLRAFSYRQAKPGKVPVIGGRPQKGNGPVKLQTSRRLSSGEILVTQQDSRRTLEEIREGEYIVPVKDRRDSRVWSPSLSRQQQHVPLNPISATMASPALIQPPAQQGWGSLPGSSTLLNIPEHNFDPNRTPLSVQSAPDPTYEPDMFNTDAPAVEGLGLSGTTLQPPSAPLGILKSRNSSPVSILEPHEEQNATIRALWKAEYGRLVSMYGQAGVDRNIAELRKDQGPPKEGGSSPFVLEPLPQPGLETRDGSSVPKPGTNSRSDPTQLEGDSDESSHQRLSFISSVGYASSHTTRASFAETDSINTRDDIRKMVDDMRSTYLKAIESREPSLQAVKSLKKTKKRKSTTPTATPRTSTAIPPPTPTMKPSTPEAQERRAMSGLNPSPPLHSQRSTRNFSSPVGGINKLPAIEASPSRDREPEIGLKRADSSTLGALMGEHKRSSIQKRKSKRHSRRISAQRTSSLQNISPGKRALQLDADHTQDNDVAVLDEEFQNLYTDIFRTSTHDFWQSSPALTPSIGIPFTIPPSPDRPPPPIPM